VVRADLTLSGVTVIKGFAFEVDGVTPLVSTDVFLSFLGFGRASPCQYPPKKKSLADGSIAKRTRSRSPAYPRKLPYRHSRHAKNCRVDFERLSFVRNQC